MARPRFQKLSAEQQELILDAARQEFAANGFGEASLNRIIEAAGISKGSMYYYFDSKEDLYAHVIRGQLESLLEQAGPFAVPQTREPDQFWAELAGYYLRLMTGLAASPRAAALLRGWLGASSSPALVGAQQEAEREALPWVMRMLEAGQEIGAVRTDLPADLLIAVVMAMGQAVDIWLVSRDPGTVDLEQAAGDLIGMMRRAVGP